MKHLDDRLDIILSKIWISRDGLRANIDGHEVEAGSNRRLQQLTMEAIYELFHAGNRPSLIEREARLIRDPLFESKISQATPHSKTEILADLVENDTFSRHIANIEGVRVRVPSSGEMQRETLRIPAHRPGLSPGFYLVDGSQGRPGVGPLLRIYFHLVGPDEALTTWTHVLQHMESRSVRYRAKVVSSPRLFPRADAMVLYVGTDALSAIPSAVKATPSRTDPWTSRLTKTLDSGISLAWEPEDPRAGFSRMSFGQHRSAVIADALMRWATAEGPSKLETFLRKRLIEANVDPRQLYRNLNSPQVDAFATEVHITFP